MTGDPFPIEGSGGTGRSSLGRNAGLTVGALVLTGLVRLLAKIGAAEISVAALGMVTAGSVHSTVGIRPRLQR